MTIDYVPRGVCARRITIELKDDVIETVKVMGGCSGNLQGLTRLLRGMRREDAIRQLEGIRCGMKPTSCPDQIARALKTGAQ